LIGSGYQLTADAAVDNTGVVFFTDAQTSRILKIDLVGKDLGLEARQREEHTERQLEPTAFVCRPT
jgi:hypothetical protein